MADYSIAPNPMLQFFAGLAKGGSNFIQAKQQAEYRNAQIALKQQQMQMQQKMYDARYGDVTMDLGKMDLINKFGQGTGADVKSLVNNQVKSVLDKASDPVSLDAAHAAIDNYISSKSTDMLNQMGPLSRGPKGLRPDPSARVTGQMASPNPNVAGMGQNSQSAQPAAESDESQGPVQPLKFDKGMEFTAPDRPAPTENKDPFANDNRVTLNRGEYNAWIQHQKNQNAYNIAANRDTTSVANKSMDVTQKINETNQRYDFLRSQAKSRDQQKALEVSRDLELAHIRGQFGLQEAALRGSGGTHGGSAGVKMSPGDQEQVRRLQTSIKATQATIDKWNSPQNGISFQLPSEKSAALQGLQQKLQSDINDMAGITSKYENRGAGAAAPKLQPTRAQSPAQTGGFNALPAEQAASAPIGSYIDSPKFGGIVQKIGQGKYIPIKKHK